MFTSFRTVAACLLAAGCAASCGGDRQSPGAPTPPPAPAPAIDITMSVQAGQTSGVADTPLTVTFERVSEDSRCPATALCITSGQVVLQLTVRQSSRAPADPLSLATVPGRDAAEVAGYRFTLEGVTPYPVRSPAEIAPGDYRASLRVVRR